ncbi:MAG: bifunctional nuclease domain-containing protein [Bacteroidota bacterium]|nr:bifunctional nuclease domain-containing protein [Bacteroidota bacterium]|tara:strand:+ start:146 stop:787 length:642 start_codon:yes stop_codon:yes gene_type:complete
MDLIKLEIHGISYSENLSGAFALVLNESKGHRKLPVVIGGFEAQAIALALQKNIKTSRPLTHELFKGFADKFEIKLKKVIIHKLVDGVFFSNMVCEKDGDTVTIDSRTSDAIAMALRFNAPVFTYESILNEVGFESDLKYDKKINFEDSELLNLKKIDDESIKEVNYSSKNIKLKNISLKKLNEMLDNSLAEEDYELSAKIRDEIKSRQNKKQ